MSDILFSAPFSFIKPHIKPIKKKKFLFKEILKKKDLFFSSKIKVWIVNPGQEFVINSEIIDYFPNLQIIASPSTGSNHVNLDDCKKRKIKFFSLLNNRKKLNEIRASSEFTFLLILNSLRKIHDLKKKIINLKWRDNEDDLRGLELYDKKVGIVGLGRVGGNVATWCKSFGSKVSYYDPNKEISRFKKDNLNNIFKKSDIIVISPILNKATEGIINLKYLKLMKKNAHLINTSRGEVLNQEDLLKFLHKSKKNINVSCDVLSNEVKGRPLNNKLLQLYKKNKIFITPHIAGATYESQIKAAKIIIEMIKKFYEKN